MLKRPGEEINRKARTSTCISLTSPYLHIVIILQSM